MQITTSAHTGAELRAASAYLATLAALADQRESTRENLYGLAQGAAIGGAGLQHPSIAELSNKLQADNRAKHAAAQQQPQPTQILAADRPDTGAPVVPQPDAILGAEQAKDAAAALAAFGSVPTPLSVPAVPIPASATPIAAPAAAAPVAGADKRGIVWDSRIHSTPAALTAEGVWRKRRGVADDLTATVEAQQQAARAVPAPVAAVPAPPASVAVPLPPVVAAAPATVPTPPVPAPPAIASSPVAPSAPNTLAELMARCAKPLSEQRLGMAQIIAACKEAGLDGLAGLHTRPDLAPAVWAKLPAEVVA